MSEGTVVKLYWARRSRGDRPRWLLEELGVPYELIRLDLGRREHKSPEYLRVHPLGLVPALVDGERVILESCAICLHLADRFPERGLAPPPGSDDRGTYYQWMVYAVATMEPPLARFAESRDPHARAQFDEAARIVSMVVAGRRWLLGETFSAADIMIGDELLWARSLGWLESHPELVAYLSRLEERPAFQRARAD